jgi:hypothetical protein
MFIENKPRGCFVPPEVLSPWTFCLTDLLSLWKFCPSRCFVPVNILSHGFYVLDNGVSGCFVPQDVLSLDVLSGHQKYCTVRAREDL